MVMQNGVVLLSRWLKRCTLLLQSLVLAVSRRSEDFYCVQVVVVGHNSKPLAQDLQAEAVDLNASGAGLGAAAEPINVPKCRKLSRAKCRKS